MLSTAGSDCRTFVNVDFTAAVFGLTPVTAAIVALISSNVRTPMSDGRGTLTKVGGTASAYAEQTFAARAELVEAQVELVRRRALLEPDDRADRRQRLAGRGRVVRVRDHRVQQAIRLADVRLGAVHADAHALERDAARHRGGVEADELRVGEQVARAVVLLAPRT